eukprot:5989059-Pleurochrysis_carterae.AAC.1
MLGMKENRESEHIDAKDDEPYCCGKTTYCLRESKKVEDANVETLSGSCRSRHTVERIGRQFSSQRIQNKRALANALSTAGQGAGLLRRIKSKAKLASKPTSALREASLRAGRICQEQGTFQGIRQVSVVPRVAKALAMAVAVEQRRNRSRTKWQKGKKSGRGKGWGGA